jgi:four helix bundle protein
MNNKDFGIQLEKRTRKFAVKIIKLAAKLPDSPEGKVIRYQLTKAGTSIGANYREANRSRSNNEFKSKIKICEFESNETIYWLMIIEDIKSVANEDLEWLLQESNEFLALFTSIHNKFK